MSLKYQIMIFCACVCFGMRVVRSMLGVGNDSTVATRGHMFSGLFYGCCRHHSTASMATPLCVLTWFIVFE